MAYNLSWEEFKGVVGRGSPHNTLKRKPYNWFRIASKAKWQSLNDVQVTYKTAEAVGKFTVFNIKGNRYRLIVDIIYKHQRIYIKYILTHAEYDKDKWKNDPYY